MKILNPLQIKQCDEETIKNIPIKSIDLMEKAAEQCVQYIVSNFDTPDIVYVICGKGNNGGDGLAIARLLMNCGYKVYVYVLEYSQQSTSDFDENLKKYTGPISHISHWNHLEFSTTKKSIIIDAIFGNGLNKPLNGLVLEAVEKVNATCGVKVSIDMPTGVYANIPIEKEITAFKANVTLTFQCPKLSFMFKENFPYVGQFKILDIGWISEVDSALETNYYYTTLKEVKRIYMPRTKFMSKHDLGHSLIISGSYGKIGASLLTTKASLCSGAGLTTAYIPKCGYSILQSQAPEAMCLTDDNENFITTLPNLKPFSAIAIGSGLSVNDKTSFVTEEIIKKSTVPVIIDADAINVLSSNKKLLQLLKPNTILTPHTKEFERLTEVCNSDFERLSNAINFAKMYSVIIVLKGAHTAVVDANGKVNFNSTGNSSLAKGGSGDVLTGIIVSLLAQGYTSINASIMAVFIHGMSADLCLEDGMAAESVNGLDVIRNISKAFRACLN